MEFNAFLIFFRDGSASAATVLARPVSVYVGITSVWIWRTFGEHGR